jgi:hypothetical protein
MQYAAEYIRDIDILTQQAASIIKPPENEIQASIRTLSQNPVMVFQHLPKAKCV